MRFARDTLFLSAVSAALLYSPMATSHGDTHASPDPLQAEVADALERAGGLRNAERAVPDDRHRQIDIPPTPAEEIELLRRVEEEGLGINPVSATGPTVGDPGRLGRWEPLQDWPVIGVSTSLLPDGRVLSFDSVGDAPARSYSEHTSTRAAIWDPVTDTHSRVDNDTGYNLFCSGFSSLPDGRLFIAGGNADADLHGLRQTHTFNPLSDTWTLGQRMDYARWYPSVTPLPNGETLITGGGFAVSEVREHDGSIRQLTSAPSSLWDNRNYPWLQTAPDGRVAFLGPAAQLGYVDAAGSGSFQSTVRREDSLRSYGSYAMFDVGKVLVAGGGFQPSTDQRSTRVIDLNDDTVSSSGSMYHRRRQHNLTVLADGSVLATGGIASNASLVDLDNAVYEAERWDPLDGQWRRLAAEERARQYHSTALLLPDGRVLSAGGGICVECQAAGYIQKNAQVFTPPYLFRQDGSGELATRPVISSAPSEVLHDRSFAVATNQAASIVKVAMLRVGSVTHSQNMEQRYLPLSFSVSGSSLLVRSPSNANVAPPGHYLLFVIDQDGVPSVAKIVNLKNSTDSPPPPADAVNVALGGTATQSSTEGGAAAFLAIDGNTDGVAANGSVSRTLASDQPWWEVDLGEVHDIEQIVVNRRGDCCTANLSDFHVVVSATPFSTRDLSTTLAQPSVGDYYRPDSGPETRLDIGRPGRYVRVQLAGRSALDLAEVQVLASGGSGAVSCGSPRVDPAVDPGVYVWKECDGGPWTLMLTGASGAGSTNAVGTITSRRGFTSVTPRSIEPADTLTVADPRRSDFDLTTGSPWADHFEFTAPAGDALCLALDTITGGQQLYIGPYRVPAGTGPIDPATLQSCELGGYDCSDPDVDLTSDRALLAWVDCDGVLHLVGTGGQGAARYSGHVHSDTRFTESATHQFESSDTLVAVSDADFYFDMGMGGGYGDEILLTPAGGGTGLCVEITDRTAGTVLLAGANRTPVTSPFDPLTLAPCVPPKDPSDCGDPRVDTLVDSALFVWKGCDGAWSVTLTGSGAGGSVVDVVGSIVSSAGVLSLAPKGVENSDSLTLEPDGSIAFDMRTVTPWSDGFEFEVPDGATLCVSVTAADAAVELLAGSDRTPVGDSFDPQTYTVCR